MLTIKRVDWNTITKLEWDELVAQSQTASIFQTYAWIKVWLDHFREDIDDLLILAVYDTNNLIGIGPFSIKNNTLGFLTSSNILADCGDIIVATNNEESVWKVIIEYLQNLCMEKKYILDLRNVRQESPTFQVLIDIIKLNFEIHIMMPIIYLPNTWDKYLKTLKNKERGDLRRRLRNAQQDLALIKPYIDQKSLDEYCDLIQRANQLKQEFIADKTKAFFLSLLTELSLSDNIYLYFLTYQGNIASALIILRFKNGWYAYNALFDLSYAKLSPGILILALVIQEAIEKNILLFSFLRGSEKYKYKFAPVDEANYRFMF